MKSPWILAVAALAFACPGVYAQDTTTAPNADTTATAPVPSTDTTTSTATTDTTTTATTDTTGAMAMPMAMTPALRYDLLATSPYTYSELEGARAKGLSDRQVATVAKITDMTGAPFESNVDAVLRGQTFSSMANEYNLRLQDVLNVDDESDKISAYKAAYEATGYGAIKNDHRMSY